VKEQDILRMARECFADPDGSLALLTPELTEFAALVAAAERERIISANAPEIERINSHIKELEAAVMAEREACAKVCEDTTAAWTQPVYNGACMDCATAIRARGNK
jgi:hypothetical protein